MVRSKPWLAGKIRTSEHIISDLSIHYVEAFVLRCGFVVEHVNPDYGYDLRMSIFGIDGAIDAGQIRFQVKATRHLNVLRDGKTISFRIERRDIRLWLDEIDPVILVIYDVVKERAYWLYTQQYLAEQPTRKLFGQGTVSLRIPMKNRINRRAILKFAEFRDQAHGFEPRKYK